MSDRAGFLKALKADRDDDTTRLVYADWLEEHGEPIASEVMRKVRRPVCVELLGADAISPVSSYRRFQVDCEAIDDAPPVEVIEFAALAHALGVPRVNEPHPLYPTLRVGAVDFQLTGFPCGIFMVRYERAGE